MKKTIYTLILLAVSFNLSACESEPQEKSTFMGNFTIGTIVEDNAQYLIPEVRELFSSEYGSTGQPFTQKQEEIALHIAPAELPTFIASIQSGIEEAIINNNASVVGYGTGGVTGTSFSIQYCRDQTYGVINV